MESIVENIIRYAGTVEQFTAVQYAQEQLKERMELLQKELRETKRLMKANK